MRLAHKLKTRVQRCGSLLCGKRGLLCSVGGVLCVLNQLGQQIHIFLGGSGAGAGVGFYSDKEDECGQLHLFVDDGQLYADHARYGQGLGGQLRGDGVALNAAGGGASRQGVIDAAAGIGPGVADQRIGSGGDVPGLTLFEKGHGYGTTVFTLNSVQNGAGLPAV